MPETHTCECGCGQPTALARKTYPARGWVKGEPLRCLPGHKPKEDPPFDLAALEAMAWRRPDLSWRKLADMHHVSRETVRDRLRERGWAKTRGHWQHVRLLRAPCEVCGTPFPVTEGQTMRRCESDDCQMALVFTPPEPAAPELDPAVALYRAEREAYLLRTASARAARHAAVQAMTQREPTIREYLAIVTGQAA